MAASWPIGRAAAAAGAIYAAFMPRSRIDSELQLSAAQRREHARERLAQLSPGGAPDRPIRVASAAVIEVRTAALACPQCLRPMQPVMLGGAHVARCAPDDQLWFDASDLESVVVRAGARHHSQRSWLGRLLAHLFAS